MYAEARFSLSPHMELETFLYVNEYNDLSKKGFSLACQTHEIDTVPDKWCQENQLSMMNPNIDWS